VSGVAVVASVTPSTTFNDRTTVVTLTGSRFVGATAITLGNPAATALTGVQVLSDTSMRGTLPRGLAAGSYDLFVTTPQGTSAAGAVQITVRNLIDPDQAGAFAVGTLDTTIAGATGDRPAARIYYPALSPGTGALPAADLAPYPAVVFNHAFKPPIVSTGIDHRQYAYLCGWLASFGYVVISTDLEQNTTLLGTAGSNAQRDADDARAALDDLAARTTTPGNPLFGMVDAQTAGTGGHSRGGDASLIACSDEAAARGANARFKAVFVLGAPSFDPAAFGARIALGNFTSVPCLAIGASKDTVVPIADQQDIFAQAGSPSGVFEIIGGNHSQYTDTGAQLLFDGTPTITLATQQAICRRYVTSWFGYVLKGQTADFARFVPGGAVFQADARLQNRASK
jgi:predicted dienelactone hydrolase